MSLVHIKLEFNDTFHEQKKIPANIGAERAEFEDNPSFIPSCVPSITQFVILIDRFEITLSFFLSTSSLIESSVISIAETNQRMSFELEEALRKVEEEYLNQPSPLPWWVILTVLLSSYKNRFHIPASNRCLL